MCILEIQISDKLFKWVKVEYNNSKSGIFYNGWVLEDFYIKRDIRQGCLFSPLAFIIGLELLAMRFRDV